MPVSSTPTLLALLALEGPASRAALARSLGVSRQAASTSTRPLLAAGLVEEVPQAPSSRRTELRLTPRAGLLTSLVLTRDTYSASVATMDGRTLGASSGPTPTSDARSQLRAGTDALEALLTPWRSQPAAPLLCHLAVPTQCDARTGKVFPSPASQYWVGVNPLAETAEALGGTVVVENTSRLEAYAEHLAHQAPPTGVTCYARFSHGVSLGHVVAGRLLGGSHGGAGELGHTVCDPSGPLCACGNRGCLMQYASLPALDTTLRPLGTDAATALTTDPERLPRPVHDALYEAGQVAGRALAGVANLLDPDLLVVGGELGTAPGPFFQALRSTVEQTTLPLISTSMIIGQALSDQNGQAASAVAISALREDAPLIEAQLQQLSLP